MNSTHQEISDFKKSVFRNSVSQEAPNKEASALDTVRGGVHVLCVT